MLRLFLLALTSAVVVPEEIELGTDGMPMRASSSTGTSGGGSCVDTDDRCSVWSSVGECSGNEEFMHKACPQSCGFCNNDGGDEDVPAAAVEDLTGLGAEHGEAQTVESHREEETRALIAKTDEYMKTKVFVEETYRPVRADCLNREKMCSFWAVEGECEANPAYMTIQCTPACLSCERINIEHRCPLDLDKENDIYAPGDLNRMFERVTNTEDPEMAKLSPSVLSQPPDGPWVVSFDTFLTKEEYQVLLKYGEVEGYERSTDVGKRQFDGSYDKHESDSRTSSNAWCRDQCYEDPVVRKVLDKIATLTGIPERHSEHLQLLKYNVGQYYKR